MRSPCRARTLLIGLVTHALIAISSGHGDSLPHPHVKGSLSAHPRQDRCTTTTREIFPLGGPFTGGTPVTVTGKAFQDLGDVKCRFGIDEVAATLVNETRIECVSPGCGSPSCTTGQEQTQVIVSLEVSMNGVSFTGTGLQFTYYDMNHVAISYLTPSGGPRAGAVPLLVHGKGFRDLSAGVGRVFRQGLRCKFGSNDMVDAQLTNVGDSDVPGRSTANCSVPDDQTWPIASSDGQSNSSTGGENATTQQIFHAVPVELTFNR